MKNQCHMGLHTHHLPQQVFPSIHISFFAQIEMMAAGPQGRGSSVSVGEGAGLGSGAPAAAVGGGVASQGPILQFFTKLRRHASLEGASPYFKIKKWKLDSSQRASSLDTRGNTSLKALSKCRILLLEAVCISTAVKCRISWWVFGKIEKMKLDFSQLLS